MVSMDGLQMSWSATVTLDGQAYSLQVAHKVAYALAATLTILVGRTGDHLELRISPAERSDEITESSAQELVVRSLNDFALREHIQRETAGLRELLAQAALKEAGL